MKKVIVAGVAAIICVGHMNVFAGSSATRPEVGVGASGTTYTTVLGTKEALSKMSMPCMESLMKEDFFTVEDPVYALDYATLDGEPTLKQAVAQRDAMAFKNTISGVALHRIARIRQTIAQANHKRGAAMVKKFTLVAATLSSGDQHCELVPARKNAMQPEQVTYAAIEGAKANTNAYNRSHDKGVILVKLYSATGK